MTAVAHNADRYDVQSADGTTIAVWVEGDGPPLVLVHGALQDHTRLGPLVDALRHRVTTFAMDRRGRGSSGDGLGYAIEREFEGRGRPDRPFSPPERPWRPAAAEARLGGQRRSVPSGGGCGEAVPSPTVARRMDRSLLRGRWLVGHVVVVVTAVAMVNLGMWQLRRLDERRAANAEVLAGGRTTVALDAVASPADDEVGDARFRRVTVDGTFDTDREVLVRFRTNDGLPGYDVVTPLVTDSGTAVLVNRGWVPVELGERWPAPGTRPPGGTVTVTGLLRQSEAADRFRPTPGDEPPLVVGAIVTPRLEERLGLDLYPGWLHLQEPDDASSFPEPLPEPALDEGPHLTYAIQWFAFAAIGVVGWVFLARSSLTAPGGRRRRRAPAD